MEKRRNKIIPYNPKLKAYARQLRNNSTLSEIILWKIIKNKALNVEFHRQVPIDEYIVDFFCHELLLAIEIDGNSHLYKCDYDRYRQNKLEKLGVQFLRFSDMAIKKDIDNVVRILLSEVERLQRINSDL